MSERVRVLWLTKGLGRGGVERLITSSIQHLDHERLDVEVAYILPWKDACVTEIIETGVAVHCLGRAGWSNSLWPLRLRALVRDKRYDIVHTHMPLSAAIARIALGHRPQFVHTEHNVWARHRTASRWANALTYGQNDAVVAVSESVARSIRPPRVVAARTPPVEVLLHGINVDEVAGAGADREVARESLGLAPTDLVVGTVGNLTRKKNQKLLLQAVGLLATRVPNVRLVIVGAGPLEDDLRRLTEQLRLTGRVVFAGSRPDVPALLPAFDVFCLSSQFEGLSIALVEAMAAGLPCVATAVGGMPEVIEDGRSGLLVPAGSTRELANELERVLLDHDLAGRLRAGGRLRSRAFDIARAAHRLQHLYEDMVVA